MYKIELMPYSTKEERRILYEKMKVIFEYCQEHNTWHYSEDLTSDPYEDDKSYVCGFCFLVVKLIGIYDMQETCPELYSQKPEKLYGFIWWKPEDRKSRIKALEEAIKLTL